MIRPVLSSPVVKAVYNLARWMVGIFRFLLMLFRLSLMFFRFSLIVTDTKLLQSVVCTGVALDRGGLATYNRSTRASPYKTIVFIILRRLCDGTPKT
ncbi:hypothetical protein DXZ79_00560 [Yersinia rochesterensis]|uniref:Uncharacterized protein n=1 Tax=Yersinia rochesterensis TaxID=1604335 RepID=A0A8D4SLJ8_9GAMM|nr:hypothetical protein DXZ79_00560 [Yersinia rochesterensis]